MTTCACANCQYLDARSATARKQNEPDSGLCRFNPPLAQPGANSFGAWPMVGQDDWCGHFAVTVERIRTAAA
jgi:hypothetical protein